LTDDHYGDNQYYTTSDAQKQDWTQAFADEPYLIEVAFNGLVRKFPLDIQGGLSAKLFSLAPVDENSVEISPSTLSLVAGQKSTVSISLKSNDGKMVPQLPSGWFTASESM
jgi:hypothetical protein